MKAVHAADSHASRRRHMHVRVAQSAWLSQLLPADVQLVVVFTSWVLGFLLWV
jgi:hypothetical protein